MEVTGNKLAAVELWQAQLDDRLFIHFLTDTGGANYCIVRECDTKLIRPNVTHTAKSLARVAWRGFLRTKTLELGGTIYQLDKEANPQLYTTTMRSGAVHVRSPCIGLMTVTDTQKLLVSIGLKKLAATLVSAISDEKRVVRVQPDQANDVKPRTLTANEMKPKEQKRKWFDQDVDDLAESGEDVKQFQPNKRQRKSCGKDDDDLDEVVSSPPDKSLDMVNKISSS